MIYSCPVCYRPLDQLTIEKEKIPLTEAAECSSCIDIGTGKHKQFVAITFKGKKFWQELLDMTTKEGD